MALAFWTSETIFTDDAPPVGAISEAGRDYQPNRGVVAAPTVGAIGEAGRDH